MALVDWAVVALYMIITLVIGVVLARRASGSMEDFFVSGRNLPWWLAGTSMAATTFSVDTPLYIAGRVGNHGIAGNWEWWCFAFGHAVLIYIFARLWRRSSIVTDAELIEMRYSGASAAWLRGIKAFLFAVPINCIGISYVMLAVVKVIDGLGIWGDLGIAAGDVIFGMDPKLLTVIGVSVLVLVYAGLSGLWGVVITDFFQFFLGLFGAIIVCVYAIQSPDVGGLGGLVEKSQAITDFDVLAFVPIVSDPNSLFGFTWSTFAGITASTFIAYVGLQWWTFRRSDGGGEFIQRLAAARTEDEAEKSAWLFNILNYVVRTWPWVLVALAALVIFPDLEDKELGYPRLMIEFLPSGLLGLVVASLIAAFMSTVSTNINWGASYLTNDIYQRFLRPEASESELVTAGRVASVLITALGATFTVFAEDVGAVFQLVIAIGTGPGVVLILRWFWWRINAWAELAAMIAGFSIGLITTLVPELLIEDFGLRLMSITGFTALVWITVMYLTPSEPEETLIEFYRDVRPPGPGWKRQREATGLAPSQSLSFEIKRVLSAIMVLFGLMFGTGALLLMMWPTAIIMSIMAAVGIALLVRLRGQKAGDAEAASDGNTPA